MNTAIGVWFPCIRANSGVDIFTIRLVDALNKQGIRAEIAWLPHRAEYLPWTVPLPTVPKWVTITHINSWLPKRFIPKEIPFVVTFHSCPHDIALRPYKNVYQHFYHKYWVKKQEGYSIAKAKSVTAVSQYTANKIIETFTFNNIDIILNSVDTNLFSPLLSLETKEKHDTFKLLFVGSLRKMKGADLLPRIMRELGNSYTLYYTADEDDYDSSIQIPENMFPLGKLNVQSELIKLYQNNDALLFPTRLEGLSLAALEAQSCGLPIITTNGSSMPEIVQQGKTGFLCEQDNVHEFIARIKQLKNSPELLTQLAVSARERGVRFFSEPHMVNKYIRLYQQDCIDRLMPGKPSK